MLVARRLAASAASACTTVLCVERTKNTDGSNSTDGVILLFGSDDTTNSGHETLVFGVGAAGVVGGTSNRGWGVIYESNIGADASFNGVVPMCPVFPLYGKWGNPMTTFCSVNFNGVAEGCFFTATLYGVTRTYIAIANLNYTNPTAANWKMAMRYD